MTSNMNSEQAPSFNSQPSSFFVNIKAGLRAAFFLPAAPAETASNWSQLVFITLLGLGIQFAADVVQIGLDGDLNFSGLPGALFKVSILLLAAWAVARLANRLEKTLLLMLLFSAISLPYSVLACLLQWAQSNASFARATLVWLNYGHDLITAAFALACGVAAFRLLGESVRRKTGLLLVASLLVWLPLSSGYVYSALWVQPYDPAGDEWDQRNKALNREETFYLQPTLLARELDAVEASKQDGISLYYVGAAGYADQDVFMKEVQYVGALFKRRFGTAGHSVMLINNAKTLNTRPIASVTSLGLSLKRIGAMMDRNKDILFLYLTSHGSKEHKFSLDFGPMQFKDLNPKELRKLLDESGIKRRIVVVSACYSGGFIDALKDENSLVITSAAADKTSFGCSNDADFTYFGKAFFDEALRNTDSFIDAFDLAKPMIAAREKKDDFEPSDPRIFVGDKIRPALLEFERQLSSARGVN